MTTFTKGRVCVHMFVTCGCCPARFDTEHPSVREAMNAALAIWTRILRES